MFTQLLKCIHLTQSRRRQWQPTPVLLPGKSHGWRSLIGFSPWGHEESDTNERLHIFFSLSCIGEGNGNPLQCSCLENPRDSTAWWAAVYGVAQSRTRLMRLSSSSNSTESQRTAQNSPSQVSTECEPWVSRYSSWIYIGQGNPRLNCQHLLCPPKNKKTPGKHLLLFAYAKDFDWHNKITREKWHENVKYCSKHGNTCLLRHRTSM